MQSLSYSLLILCTGMLYVRPTELFDSLKEAPLYEMAMLCGLAISAPRIVMLLTARSLVANPVTFCVVGLTAAVASRTWRILQSLRL